MNQHFNSHRLLQARELMGLSQAELAEKLGISQLLYRDYEAGRVLPDRALLDAISLLSGIVTPAWFYRPSLNFPMGSLLFKGHWNKGEL
jgi:transcriptional regulator with XRE-family HTH domain